MDLSPVAVLAVVALPADCRARRGCWKPPARSVGGESELFGGVGRAVTGPQSCVLGAKWCLLSHENTCLQYS
jgi:hypothetical protein